MDVVWINILFFLFFLFIIRYYISVYLDNEQTEGFIQKESFVLKMENEVYDEFYTSVYDMIFLPLTRIEKCMNTLFKTDPYIENILFLDIGICTGIFSNSLY